MTPPPQAARDETRASVLERLAHCCTVLGYALALSCAVVPCVAWISTWDWVRRGEEAEGAWLNLGSLGRMVSMVGGCTVTAMTFFNNAQASERPGNGCGPRYARSALAVGAVLVPFGYGLIWVLVNVADTNVWYSLVISPVMLSWTVLFIFADFGCRRKWYDHDSRKRQEGAERNANNGSNDEDKPLQLGSSASNVAAAARPVSNNFTDTIISLFGPFAAMSLAFLCKCFCILSANFTAPASTPFRWLDLTTRLFDASRSNLPHPALFRQRHPVPPCDMSYLAPHAARDQRSYESVHEVRCGGARLANGDDPNVRRGGRKNRREVARRLALQALHGILPAFHVAQHGGHAGHHVSRCCVCG